MPTKFARELGEAPEKLIHNLVARARGGLKAIMLVNSAINRSKVRDAVNPMCIENEISAFGLNDLTKATHREGELSATKLHHAVRNNSVANTDGGMGPGGPSLSIVSSPKKDAPRDLSPCEIAAVVQEFKGATGCCVAEGLDAVELQVSRGYFSTHFLTPQFDLRTNECGESFENRARFSLETIRAVLEEIRKELENSYRHSFEARTVVAMDAQECIAFCRLLEPYANEYNVTATCESEDSIFMREGRAVAEPLPLRDEVKSLVHDSVSGPSRQAWALDLVAEENHGGQVDLVVGRTQVAETNFVLMLKSGRSKEIRRWIGCSEYVGTLVLGGWPFIVMNPDLGVEFRYYNANQEKTKTKMTSHEWLEGTTERDSSLERSWQSEPRSFVSDWMRRRKPDSGRERGFRTL